MWALKIQRHHRHHPSLHDSLTEISNKPFVHHEMSGDTRMTP